MKIAYLQIFLHKMTRNNRRKKMAADYEQLRSDFLDNLQPDDFRNAESFNQAGMIIDNLIQAFYQATINKKNPEEFIGKALSNLFRKTSPAIAKATRLSKIYLEMKLGNN